MARRKQQQPAVKPPLSKSALRDRAIDAVIEGIVISDHRNLLEHPVIYVNPAYERITGYSRDEIIGKDCRFLQGKDNDQPGIEQIRKALKKNTNCRAVVRNYRKDGTMFWNELYISPIKNDAGKVTHYVGIANDVTERIKTENELAESEKRYRELFEKAPVGFHVFGKDCLIQDINETELDMLGYSRDEIVGKKRWCELVVAEQREKFRRHWDDIFTKGEARNLEYAVVRKDGSRIDVIFNALAEFDKDGQFLSTRGSVINITARKKAQDALRASEQKYRLLFEANPNPMWVYDIDTLKFLAVNDMALIQYGYSRGEFLNMTIKDIRPSEDVPSLLESIAAKKEGMDYGGVWRHRKKDGTIFFAETVANTIFFENRPAQLVLAIDVTERKKAEDKVRSYFDVARVVILVLGIDKTVLDINQKGCDVLGYSKDKIIGKNWFDTFIPKNLQNEVKAVFEKLVTGEIEPVEWFENPVLTSGGEERILEWHNAILRDDYGKVISVLSSGEDITDRKLAEKERTVLLKTLAAKNKELESILYVASHDLRSPLVNIQGFGYELANGCEKLISELNSSGLIDQLDEKAKTILKKDIPEAINYITVSSAKIDTLLLGLLRLSRTGRAAMNVEKLDMNHLVANVLSNLSYLIQEKNVTVHVDDLPSCMGDASQINQVFANLVDNAIKYLDESKPGMVHIYGRIQNGDSIYCIQDNGVGIAKEYQSKVFEIFQRLEPAKSWGEGLGLTIVRRIVDRHNGKVWVESSPRKGSRFYVLMPNR
ncbi:MAG: PAS domain S-box protein [Phycisphaerae bacterium]|nr:PAS domain S-box protein [Phycisphaerae bacterium]